MSRQKRVLFNCFATKHSSGMLKMASTHALSPSGLGTNNLSLSRSMSHLLQIVAGEPISLALLSLSSYHCCGLCLCLAHYGSFWLYLAHSGSNWLSLQLSLALSGARPVSLWRSMALSGDILGEILRDIVSYQYDGCKISLLSALQNHLTYHIPSK